MTINFTIPEWVLWLIGIPLGLAVLCLAVFGVVMLNALKGGIYK